MTDAPAPEIPAALARLGLVRAGEAAVYTPLSGGVSSDIWRVEAGGRVFCVKRALPKLKVKADWFAPVVRNGYEALWLRLAAERVPGSAPRLLGEDAEAGLFAMEWLPARLWKARLLAGEADPAMAAAVGERLARLHSSSTGDAALFPTDAIFHAIRLEPYLLATAEKHPDLAGPLRALAEVTATTPRCVVHGDVSPKNILDGPVFLDAECAWYGDPAFDIAFCLNHMLLKCIARPEASAGFLGCFDALAGGWLRGVDWEPPAEAGRRAARLLPGLFLGRVDGKSPVEYLTEEADKARVRKVARALLIEPPETLGQVRAVWSREVGAN